MSIVNDQLPSNDDSNGWLSGSMGIPLDQYAGSPLVEMAVSALMLFPDVNRDEARLLLMLWTHGAELSDRERQAVLSRFPQRHDS